jgi:hypothetical protein
MLIKSWRFITTVFVALSLGMAFCHLLQLPTRMSYDAEMWRNTQSMYQYFGPPIGAIIESGAWLSVVVLAVLLRRRHPAFGWALVGAICMVTAQAAWWVLVNPVNNIMMNWTPATIPSDWAEYRLQWEYAHAARAIMQFVGFSALLISMLVETPSEIPRPAAARAHLREVPQA